jgi:adenylate cyclase 8
MCFFILTLEIPSWLLVTNGTLLLFSHRDFLGTKEASLLLMAMFLLAVFYHGQQVMPCFSLAMHS